MSHASLKPHKVGWVSVGEYSSNDYLSQCELCREAKWQLVCCILANSVAKQDRLDENWRVFRNSILQTAKD